jgi:uncharacterized protein involved in outer membrane biogenesis
MQFTRRRLIALASIAFAVLGYTAAGFWLVPMIARSQLQKFASETLHRQLSLGSVQFNPYTLELRVSEFALKENDGSALLGFRQLYIDAELASLWQRRINLSEVQLEAPDIRIAIDAAGKLNLANLLPASDAGDKTASTAPPRIRIGLLSVTQGHVAVSDLSKGAPYRTELQPLAISLKEFSTDSDYKNAYRISAQTTLGEQLELAGDFTVQPLASSGNFAIKLLQLPPLAAYAAASLPFQVADGKLSLEGKYTFAAAVSPVKAPEWQLTLDKITGLNFAIAERNAVSSKPALVIPVIDIVGVVVSPVDRNVTIKQAVLGSPSVDIRRDSDGVLNLSRLLASSDTKAPVSKLQPAAEQNTPATTNSNQSPQPAPWQLKIIDSRIETGTVSLADATVTPAVHFTLTPVSLQIVNLGTGSDPIHLSGDVVIDNGARLKLNGDLKVAPLQAAVNIDLDNFALSSLQPYLDAKTQLSLDSGLFSLHGHFDYGQPADASDAAVNFAGDVSVDNLHSADKTTGAAVVDWKQLAITGIKVAANAGTGQLTSFSIDNIVADQPFANIEIAKDKSLNVAQALTAPGTASAKPVAAGKAEAKSAKPAAQATVVTPGRIGNIKIIDGSANFSDLSIEPNFSSGIVELNGTVSGLSSQAASRAKVALQGKVDRFAPVEISGETNMLSANLFTDVRLKFSNMELTTFDPYSGKFAGYNISKGKLSAELHYQINNRMLDAQHHVVIDNLEFGSKTDSKDAAPIPVKLAVALLKDSNGVIELDLPVSGSLDDPQFRFGPLVWKACLGLLENVATAPFAALGRLFGGGGELEYV